MTRFQILTFISDLDGWLSLHEGFFLYECAKSIKGKGEIVEIGSWMGKSTICLAAGSMEGKKKKVFAIDPHKGEFTKNDSIGKRSPTFKKFKKNIQDARVSVFVTPMLATSKKAASNWDKDISFLFIDGLHDYKNTKQDYELWSPYVRVGGIIAFHDAFCGHIGPERIVVEKILHQHWEEIGVVGSIIYVKKGKPKNLWQHVNIFRHTVLIRLALWLNKKTIEKSVKFFVIHRIIKVLLINRYTFLLQLGKA